MQSVLEKAKIIRMTVFDVDGVLTDGSLHIAVNGEESKTFNSRDGHGMKMLKASGVELAIITSRESRCVDLRAQDLGITLVFQGAKNKLQ
ncbi:MAG: phenylphosphate carboxylase subunit delta, partial [Nitrosomonadaceae bacterium]|nr:phenylphosphate carboxylase subunit delta [Nitrosomonadaceae bacterium]